MNRKFGVALAAAAVMLVSACGGSTAIDNGATIPDVVVGEETAVVEEAPIVPETPSPSPVEGEGSVATAVTVGEAFTLSYIPESSGNTVGYVFLDYDGIVDGVLEFDKKGSDIESGIYSFKALSAGYVNVTFVETGKDGSDVNEPTYFAVNVS